MKQFQYQVKGFKVSCKGQDTPYQFTLAIPDGAVFRDVYGYLSREDVGLLIFYEFRRDKETQRTVRHYFLLPATEDAAFTTHPDVRYEYLASIDTKMAALFLYEVKDA